ARLDDVVETALPEEPPGRIQIAAIASAEIAVFIERLIGRNAEIAHHQSRTFDGDLAAFADWYNVARQRIDDLDAVAGEGQAVAGGGDAKRRVGGIAGTEREGFGIAVAVLRFDPIGVHRGMARDQQLRVDIFE